MASTRRLFLQDAAILAAATALPGKLLSQPRGVAATGDETEDALTNISAETFQPWIRSSFEVSRNQRPQGDLTLISVIEADDSAPRTVPGRMSARASARLSARAMSTPKSPMVDSFTLRFQRTGVPLPQETYTLKHSWLGTFDLLLVPSGLAGRTSTCSAVFSLLARA
jgi:hypothetical protein